MGISELDFPLLAGIMGSVVHVVSGPDHLVAVATFAIEEKRKAWKIISIGKREKSNLGM